MFLGLVGNQVDHIRAVIEGAAAPLIQRGKTRAGEVGFITEYTIKFEYNGEEVPYRGNSGQTATLTVEANSRVELSNVKVSGGKANIGNIKFVNLGSDDDDDEGDDEDDDEDDDDDEVKDDDAEDDDSSSTDDDA